jgi:fluoride exporter
LVINVSGSFLMGLLMVLFLERSMVSVEVRAAILIGLLGAFTTFSTFSIETVTLMEQAYYLKGLLNALASVTLCLCACWSGLFLGRLL